MRLILSLSNNWEAYGGKAQYVKWGKAAGLNLTSDDDFFSHPTLRSYYKAHVKASFLLIFLPTNIDRYHSIPCGLKWKLLLQVPDKPGIHIPDYVFYNIDGAQQSEYAHKHNLQG